MLDDCSGLSDVCWLSSSSTKRIRILEICLVMTYLLVFSKAAS